MVIFTSKVLAVASIMALASLTSISAAADVTKYSSYTPTFENTKSRKQVHKECLQATKDGGLPKPGDMEMDAESPALAKAAPSDLQRQEVFAETIEWMRTQSATDIGMGD